MAKIDGLLVGVIANVQGLLMNYPEYAEDSVLRSLHSLGLRFFNQNICAVVSAATSLVIFRDRKSVV